MQLAALIHDEEQALAQTLDMVQAGRVKARYWRVDDGANGVFRSGGGNALAFAHPGYAPRSMRVIYTLLPESPTIEAIILRLAVDVHYGVRCAFRTVQRRCSPLVTVNKGYYHA